MIPIITINNSKKCIIATYKNFKRIDFISTSGAHLLRISFKEEKRNKFKTIGPYNVEIMGDRYVYYTYAYVSNNRIYVLCWNTKKERMKEFKVNPQIHVFSWDGTPLAQLNVDKPINCFSIDEKKMKIYCNGYDPVSLVPFAYQTDLPMELKP